MADETSKDTDDQQVIELNIGGKIFTTSLQTLKRYPDSLLGKLNTENSSTLKDSKGRFFFDRDGNLFGLILNYLRSGKLELWDEAWERFEELSREFEYYQLPFPYDPHSGRSSNKSPAEHYLDLIRKSSEDLGVRVTHIGNQPHLEGKLKVNTFFLDQLFLRNPRVSVKLRWPEAEILRARPFHIESLACLISNQGRENTLALMRGVLESLASSLKELQINAQFSINTILDSYTTGLPLVYDWYEQQASAAMRPLPSGISDYPDNVLRRLLNLTKDQLLAVYPEGGVASKEESTAVWEGILTWLLPLVQSIELVSINFSLAVKVRDTSDTASRTFKYNVVGLKGAGSNEITWQ